MSEAVEPGTVGGDQTADGGAVYSDLVKLIQHHGAVLGKGERVYEVIPEAERSFVVTNSQGNAALAVCCVRLVKDKELVKAAFEAMGAKVG